MGKKNPFTLNSGNIFGRIIDALEGLTLMATKDVFVVLLCLADIATAQPSFQNRLLRRGAQTLIHGKVSGKFASGPENRLAFVCKPLQIPNKVDFYVGHLKVQWGKFLIQAVAALEPKCSVQGEDGQSSYDNLRLSIDSRPSDDLLQFSSEEYSELDERERLRRMRISKANKGNTPWNKGKKHSPGN